jgi:hypothetical protein
MSTLDSTAEDEMFKTRTMTKNYENRSQNGYKYLVRAPSLLKRLQYVFLSSFICKTISYSQIKLRRKAHKTLSSRTEIIMASINLLLAALLGIVSFCSAETMEAPYIKPLDNVTHIMDIDHPVKVFDVAGTGILEEAPREDFSVSYNECVNPLIPANDEDCYGICQYFQNSGGTLTILAKQVYYQPMNTCKFGIANLDQCNSVIVTSTFLAGICNSMLTNCIVNSYDAFVQGTNPSISMAMSGEEAAPPYPSPYQC